MNNTSHDEIDVQRTVSNSRVFEIVFGVFGLFGLGWLYAGNIPTAIILLIFGILLGTFNAVLVTATAGIFACCVLPVNIAIAWISANNARAWVLKNRANGSVIRLLAGLVIGVFAIFLLFSILGGILAALFAPIIESIPGA